ncbi:MAG: glycerol-3-phosphate 1-O-acyltransferase PlsY [Bacteroidota bacterium]|nr:glycerol-3-phosphate 1-O-acyltransferase PlsY [Bacteroidota bacterium]
MSFYSDIFVFAAAFLLGALPFAVAISRIFYRTDVRRFGSGNPGATNMLRSLGPAAGISVLLLDMAKGISAIFIARLIKGYPEFSLLELEALCGSLAVAGHIFSPFLLFKGGKGVATALGMIFGLMWGFGLIAFATFALTVALTRFVSLGSILAVWSFPSGLLLFYNDSEILILLAAAVALIVTIRHKANLHRLLSGNENRLTWRGKLRTKQPENSF